MKATSKQNNGPATGKVRLPLPVKLSWRWIGAVVMIAAAFAGTIYALVAGRREPAVDRTSVHAGHEMSSSPAQPDAASKAAVSINTTPPPGPEPDGMVWIPGGTYWMGCGDCGMPDALPVHLVSVDGIWMDRTPVTNAQFEKFVKATGYLTVAERKPDLPD